MKKPDAIRSPQKFGTFLGVYVPSILTILGLIMYLRFGWVVGNVGLGLTLVIVLVASSITFITGLSASAIATNIQVGVGGEYFLVSRSLGLEMGGAIGIPLYLCRTLSVTFYCFGLSEAILVFFPDVPGYGIQLLAAAFIVMVTALSGKSAGLVLKSQIPIMILVGLSILALAIGVFSHEIQAPVWGGDYRTAPEGFWYVFAVFFPAVTGFTAGIGMSGDLKDPRRSIPRGTLGAVLSGVVIYLIIPLLLSITALLTIDQLSDPDAGLRTWTTVALFGGILVIPAVWGAILSSAFGSILGGPRVLQALSQDGLAPKYFSRLSKTGQPTVATWVSGTIALAAVALGELNTVAQFVSVLFLTLYVTINSSAAIEELVNEPSYRPQIRVPWYVSLLGAAGAIWVMYLVNPIACVVALSLVAVLYIWLRSRSLTQQWGDVAAGFWMNMTRYGMIQLNKRKIHPRNWRPLILLFVRDIDKRIQLVEFAESLGQNHGILTVAKLIKSDHLIPSQERRDIEIQMATDLDKHAMDAFCEVHQVTDIHEGMLDIAKAHGLGDLRTNTVVIGWSEEKVGQLREIELIRELSVLGKNLLLTCFKVELPKKIGSIDIWWGGQENNGDLMLLLAYLLKLNQRYENAVISIRSVVRDTDSQVLLDQGIRQMLPKTRIQAEVEVLVSKDPFIDILHHHSGSSDLVMLGLPVPEKGREEQSVDSILKIVSGLRAAVLVKNNEMSDSIPILLG